MSARSDLTPELLRSLLRYDPETGRLYWLPRPIESFATPRGGNSWNTKYAGSEAFSAVMGDGYRNGCVMGVSMLAHRVAWAVHFGRWPDGQLDHINGDRTDNRLSNLRDVGHLDNHRNRKLQHNNNSGVSGVNWHKRERKWIARIGIGDKRIRIGAFDRLDDAVAARRNAENDYGYHANHGRLDSIPA